MENGINLKVIWLDEVEDLLEVVFSCSNGYFSGQAEIYLSRDDLSGLADALSGFPSRPDDSRDFELGTLNPLILTMQMVGHECISFAGTRLAMQS